MKEIIRTDIMKHFVKDTSLLLPILVSFSMQARAKRNFRRHWGRRDLSKQHLEITKYLSKELGKRLRKVGGQPYY